jgi:hypothetical protein
VIVGAHFGDSGDSPSLVMNEMNSLTHSCMHSFASFAILAFSGRAIFMMRATGAKLRMLASEAVALLTVVLGDVCGGDAEECGDEDDMALAAGRRAAQVHGGSEWLAERDRSTARLCTRTIGEHVGVHERSVDMQMGAVRRANQTADAGKGVYTHHWQWEAIGPVP